MAEISPPVTLREQLDEAYRELKMRKRVFPEWIKRGTLSEPLATRRIAALEAIIETLKTVQRAQGLDVTAQLVLVSDETR